MASPFHANATVALPLIYAVSLGVAESARDIAIELGKSENHQLKQSI